MKRKTLFIIGAILLFGAVLAAVAVAQNTDSQRASTGHECTPEMMENMASNNTSQMAKNCAPEMMESGNCDMADAAMSGCGSMRADADSVTENQMSDPDHCSNMDPNMGSMMGTGKQKTMA